MASDLERIQRALEEYHYKLERQKMDNNILGCLELIHDAAREQHLTCRDLQALIYKVDLMPTSGVAFFKAYAMICDIWSTFGRTKYYEGVSLENQGKNTEAIDIYKEAISAFSHAWSATMYNNNASDAERRREGILSEQKRYITAMNDLLYRTAKNKVHNGELDGAMDLLNDIGTPDLWHKVSQDNDFAPIKDRYIPIIEQLEAKRHEYERQQAAESKRARINLLLQIAVPVVVFGLYFLLGFLLDSVFEYYEEEPEMGTGLALLLLVLPVIITSIAIGIINACYKSNHATIVVIVPIFVIIMAIAMANGFWGFIGYAIVLFILGTIAALPGLIIHRCARGAWPWSKK